MRICFLLLYPALLSGLAFGESLSSTVVLSGVSDYGDLSASFTFVTGPDGLESGVSGVTAAMVQFTGSGGGPTFSLGLPDLQTFRYEPSTPGECSPPVCVDDLDFSLNDGAGDSVTAAISYTAFEATTEFVGMFGFTAAGFGPVADQRGSLNTNEFTVTPVAAPEPATLAIALAAAFSLSIFRRRARG